jgi:hypothetical protein
MLEKEEDAKTTFSFNLSTFGLMQCIVKVYVYCLHTICIYTHTYVYTSYVFSIYIDHIYNR